MASPPPGREEPPKPASGRGGASLRSGHPPCGENGVKENPPERSSTDPDDSLNQRRVGRDQIGP